MSNGFISQSLSEKSEWLLINYPFAFLLLTHIARRARRIPGLIDGRDVGDAEIGDWEYMGLTRQQYRTALKNLCLLNFIKIKETNRTRKKSTTGITTKGTLATLIDSDIYDINTENNNHHNNHCPTTAQPLPNHEQCSVVVNDVVNDVDSVARKRARLTKEEREMEKSIVYQKGNGDKDSVSESEVFRYFIPKPYLAETIKQAINIAKNNKYVINNIFHFLETVCKNIEKEQKRFDKKFINLETVETQDTQEEMVTAGDIPEIQELLKKRKEATHG